MDFESIFTYLQTRLISGRLNLDWDDSPEGELFAPLLCCIRPAPFFIENCQLSAHPADHPAEAVIRGRAAVGYYPETAGLSSPMDITLTLSLTGNELEYCLEAALRDGFTFGELFGELPPLQAVTSSGLTFVPSYLSDLRLSNPVFRTRPSYLKNPLMPFELDALLEVTGDKWSPYAPAFAPSVHIGGKLSMIQSSAGYPVFDLEAAALRPLWNTAFSGHAGADWNIGGGPRLYLRSGLPGSDIDAVSERSAALFGFRLTFGRAGRSAEAMLPLFLSDRLLRMEADLDDGLSLGELARFLGSLLGLEPGDSLLLPDGSGLNCLRLYNLTCCILRDAAGLHLQQAGVLVHTAQPWKLPLPFLTLDELYLTWQGQWGDGPDSFLMTAAMRGTMTVELPGSRLLEMTAAAILPDLDITAELQLKSESGKDSCSLTDFMGNQPASTLPGGARNMTLARLTAAASYCERSLSLYGEVNDLLTLHLGSVTVEMKKLYAQAFFSQKGNEYLLGGIISLTGSSARAFAITLEGSYAQDEWNFRGWLSMGRISLFDLIYAFLPGQADTASSDNSFDIAVTALDVNYLYHSRSGSSDFSLYTAFQASWGSICGLPVKNGGRVMLRSNENGLNKISVMLSLDIGSFRLAAQADQFHTANPVYYFILAFRQKELRASYAVVTGEDQLPHQILRIGFQNLSLGDIAQWLTELVNPNSSFVLPSPWDFLYRIDLSRLDFEIDFTDERASFRYLIHREILGLFTLEAIGAQYDYSGNGGFTLIIDTKDRRLSWDPLREPVPSVAENPKVFHLAYLGLACHYGTPELREASSVAQAMDAFIASFDPDRKEPVYDERVNWLFGVDFTVNEALHIRMILNDPALYGILITVESSHAPFALFNGLMVELIYQKITNQLSMFRATLQLPVSMRHVDLGVLGIDIGILSIEIYSDGGFFVDLGYPENLDFSRSFAFRMGAFAGKGGVCFGVLSGAACPELPIPARGQFTNVLRIGVGMSVETGKSINLGIISGGLSAGLFGLFEGIFAIYDPGEDLDKSTYYKIHAVVGITGRVFIKVDLAIISLEASASLCASADLTLESCRCALVVLQVNLSLSARIKILFFQINVSFHFSYAFRFTIGSNQTAPWDLAALKATSAPVPVLEPVKLPGEPYQIPLKISVLFSLADQKDCAAFLPVLEEEDFQRLAELLSRWILYPFPDKPGRELPDSLTAGQIMRQVDDLCLETFLDLNLTFSLSAPDLKNGETAGMVLPMPPPVKLSLTAEEEEKPLFQVSYWQDNTVPVSYAGQLHAYFEPFLALDDTPVNAADDEEIPLANLVFLDYIHMLLRELAQKAAGLYERHDYTAESVDWSASEELFGLPLSTILSDNPQAALSPRQLILPAKEHLICPGETLQDIARNNGLTPAAVLKTNCLVPSLLQADYLLSIEENCFANKTGLEQDTVAALFFVRRGLYTMEHYFDLYMEPICAQLPLDVSLENVTRLTLPIGLEGLDWTVLPGDTVETLSKLCTVCSGKLENCEEWIRYRQSVRDKNLEGDDKMILLPAGEFLIPGDITMEALYQQIFAAEPGEDLLFTAIPFLRPNARIRLEQAVCPLPDPCTVQDVLDMRLSPEELAEGLRGTGGGIFLSGQTVKVSSPLWILRELIQDILTDPAEVANLGSAASRFLLQGLRIPQPGTETSAPTGFYKALMQQVPYEPKKYKKQTLEISAREKSFVTGSFQMDILKEQLWRTGEFDWTKVYSFKKPPELPAFVQAAAFYSLNQGFIWDRKNFPPLALHPFSSSLSGDYSRMVQPVLSSGEEEYDILHTGVLISLAGRRAGDAVSLEGASPSDRLLLQQVISCGEPVTYTLFHEPSPLDGLRNHLTEFPAEDVIFLFQTNLSRQTRMFPENLFRAGNRSGQHVSAYGRQDFLTLIWECSTVGGGGYTLCPEEPLEGELYDAQGRIRLWLMIQDTEHGLLKNITNCAVSEQAVLTARNAAFAVHDCAKDSPLLQWQPALPPGCAGIALNAPAGTEPWQEVFNILSYQVDGPDYTLVQGRISRPLLPRDESGRWAYDIIAPLYRMIGQGNQNPYPALGKSARITVHCCDVLGNPAPGTLQYTVTPAINDWVIPPGQWPSVTLSFTVEEGPYLILRMECADEKPEEPKQAAALLRRSLWQLEAGASLTLDSPLTGSCPFDTSSLKTVTSFGQAVWNFLEGTGTKPQPCALLFSCITSAYPAEYFPLTAAVSMQRSGGPKLPPQAVAAVSIVPARVIAGLQEQGAAESLEQFAGQFEHALPGLKLARTGDGVLYVVQTGDSKMLSPVNIRSFDYSSGIHAPVFYAFRPICSHSVSRTAALETYDSNWRPAGQITEQNFTGIDVDGCVSRFFEDIEFCFLEDQALMLDKWCREQPDMQAVLQKLIETKETLAKGMASYLVPVTPDAPTGDLASAREIAQDRLCKNLIAGSRIACIAEYQMNTQKKSYRLSAMLQEPSDARAAFSMSKLDLNRKSAFLIVEAQSPCCTGFTLDGALTIQDIEYEISSVIDRYETSRWLRLLCPIKSGDPLLQADFTSDLPAPNPLRRYPQPVQLLGQSFSMQAGEKQCLYEWQHQIHCQWNCAEQDSCYFEIGYDAEATLFKADRQTDLVDVLCQYDALRTRLLHAMWKEGDCKAFALFTKLAVMMSEHLEDGISRVRKRSDARMLQCCAGYDGKLGEAMLTECSPGWDAVIQSAASDSSEPGDPITFSLQVNHLPVYDCHTAHTAARTVRNQNILAASKPGQEALSVDPAFIYRTETVKLPAFPVRITNTQEILLGQAAYGDVETAFELVCHALDLTNRQNLAGLTVWYRFTTASANIRVQLPVTMFLDFTAGDLSGKPELAQTVRHWIETEQPCSYGSALLFDLNIYGKSNHRILLSMERLCVEFKPTSLIST